MFSRQTSRPNVFSRVWSKAFASGRCKASAVRPRVRPRLEHLEDRLVPAVIDVTTLADGTGPGTLRSAIAQANTNDAAGDTNNTINLTLAGTYNIGQSGLGGLQIFSNATTGQSGLNLTIQNTSGGAIAISGNNMTRVFDINPNDINGGATPNGTILGAVTINGVTIQNGLAQAGDGATGSGGGIRDLGPVDLTLNNDVLTNNSATADGGGVSMENTVSTKWKLTLNNTTVTNNHAGDAGGGVETDGSGILNINNSTIANNTCVNQGAGIWLDAIAAGIGANNSATLSVTNTVISGNTAGMVGGGIGNAGNGAVSVANSTVENNFTVGSGGGFVDFTAAASLTVQNSLFLNNSAGLAGGGIGSAGNLTISNSEIKGNAAGINGNMPIGSTGSGKANTIEGGGGGIFVNAGTLTVTDSTIADNTSPFNGGGIELMDNVTATIRNSTIVDNTALNNAPNNTTILNDGGGIDDAGAAGATPAGSLALVNDTVTGNFAVNGGGVFFSNAATLTIQNTILAQNAASTTGPDFDILNHTNTTVDLGGNLIGIGNTTIFNSPSTQQGTVANPLNPQLSGLTDNGGSVAGASAAQMTVQTEALLPISPAILKGVNNGITTDERGAPRVNGEDVGAFQYQNVALSVKINAAPTVALGSNETITVTVTNTSPNTLPADNGSLVVTTTGGLNLGAPQRVALNALGAGQSAQFTFTANATALGAQTITAAITTPDSNPLTVTNTATVNIVPNTTPTPQPTTPIGGLTLFGIGLGPTGIDLFEVDSAGNIFAVPLSGAGPIFLNTALHLPLAAVQEGKILALLAGANGQTFVIDIINPFLPSVMSAVLAALHL